MAQTDSTHTSNLNNESDYERMARLIMNSGKASEKLTVEQALEMARRCRYLDNGPVCYDKSLYGAVWALADEVLRLRGSHEPEKQA